MAILNAPMQDGMRLFDLTNKAKGESSTYKGKDKYDDYVDVKTNGMYCSGQKFTQKWYNEQYAKGIHKVLGTAPKGKVCPTDGAPFEVFTITNKADYKGKYWQRDNTHHTANQQAVRQYVHDLDNTTMIFRACDEDKTEWTYSRENITYVTEDFNITHLIPPEEQIHELDVTKPVMFPAQLGKFRFFGVDYNQVKMSGHGYISFGGTVGDDFTESISEWGKYKMVAALWDDLNPSGGFNPHLKMGIPKNVYAVHEKDDNQMIFQWHFIPETAVNWRNQKTSDENIFRIVLDFDTNEIEIKTGSIESKDGIVGITGGVDKAGNQFGHHHVDFTSDYGCAAPGAWDRSTSPGVLYSPPNFPQDSDAPLQYPRSGKWQVNNAYADYFLRGANGDKIKNQCTFESNVYKAGDKKICNSLDHGECLCERCCNEFCTNAAFVTPGIGMTECQNKHCNCVQKLHSASGGGGAGGY
jgi:hypothetical protein